MVRPHQGVLRVRSLMEKYTATDGTTKVRLFPNPLIISVLVCVDKNNIWIAINIINIVIHLLYNCYTMKKLFAFRFDKEKVKDWKLKAKKENRSLTNFIEIVMDKFTSKKNNFKK